MQLDAVLVHLYICAFWTAPVTDKRKALSITLKTAGENILITIKVFFIQK